MKLIQKIKCFFGLHQYYTIVVVNEDNELVRGKICRSCGHNLIQDLPIGDEE